MDFRDILLVSDYDNTLTGDRHIIPQENIDAILDFTAQGGAFTIASGRGKREWKENFSEVPFNAPLILSNGAVIYDTKTDRELFHALLTEKQKELAKKLFLSLPEGCSGLVEAGGGVYIPGEIYEMGGFKGWFPKGDIPHPSLEEIPDCWDKVSFISPLPDLSSYLEKNFDIGMVDSSGLDILQKRAEAIGLPGVRSLPVMYEISPEGTDKGMSARKLLGLIGKKVLVCAGDAPNDAAMLREADYCFVPRESLLAKESGVPEGAIMTVRCEKAAIADVIRQLKAMQ